MTASAVGIFPAPRKRSRRRLEPGGTTTGMRHRRPHAGCPLCPIWGVAWDPDQASTHGRQHIHAEILWHAWGGGRGNRWPAKVVAAAKTLGVTCTEEQAKSHFRHHRIEQPALSGSLRREHLLGLANRLEPLEQQIITSVYRQRLLSTEQIREVFFATGHSEATAKWMANTVLPRLASQHLLYRFYPDKRMSALRDAPPSFAKQSVWLMGRGALPFVEDRYSVTVYRDHYVQMAKEVAEETLIHDLRANGLYVAVHRAVRERGELLELPDGSLCAAEMRPENWYGPKHLSFGFYDQHTRAEREIRADGFATLSLHRSAWATNDALPSTQLPFFYEYDHGSRNYPAVTDQLLAYHLLARARKAGQRFPDLNVEGYAVPVVMVFSSRSRLDGAHKAFLRYAREQRIEQGSPIFLTCEEDWLEDPFGPGIIRLAWDPDARGLSLLQMLLHASQKLIAARAVMAAQTLRIDLKAARRSPSGATSREGLADARARQKRLREEAERQRKRSEAAAQQQANRPTRSPLLDDLIPADANPHPSEDAEWLAI